MFSSSRKPVVGSLFVGCALLGAGCTESVDSENIRTKGICMETLVSSGGSSARVRVELSVGGDESNALIELTANDELIAIADGEEKEMERISLGVFEARFDGAVEEDTKFAVHLLRGDDDTDAKGSGGELPAPFNITSPLDDEPYSRAGDDIELTWDPSDSADDMVIEASDEDSCITATKDFDPSGDDGAFVIEAGELEGAEDEETCEIQLDVIRQREGVRDENLDRESTFRLRQIRSILADSAP